MIPIVDYRCQSRHLTSDCKFQYRRAENALLFEYFTLRQIYEHCVQHPYDLLYYFHSKGVRAPYGSLQHQLAKEWRTVMQYFQIERWRDCVSALLCGYDTCGVNLRQKPMPHYSGIREDTIYTYIHTNEKVYYFTLGNFWWATCAHIRTLRSPENSRTDQNVEDWRWYAEMWLLDSSRPVQPKECFNDGVDHYKVHFDTSTLYGRRCIP